MVKSGLDICQHKWHHQIDICLETSRCHHLFSTDNTVASGIKLILNLVKQLWYS